MTKEFTDHALKTNLMKQDNPKDNDETSEASKRSATKEKDKNLDNGQSSEHEPGQSVVRRQHGDLKITSASSMRFSGGTTEPHPDVGKDKIEEEMKNDTSGLDDVFDVENKEDSRSRNNPGCYGQGNRVNFLSNKEPIGHDPHSPNQIESPKFEIGLNWADEVNEETPLTQCNQPTAPWTHPTGTRTTVSTSVNAEVSRATRTPTL